MANRPIEERLLHYFLAMGAQETSAQIPQANLSFLLGADRANVVILKNEDFIQRSKVIETILGLPSLQNSGQLLYLAAPRLLGASIDAAIFRSHGIGLLLFDERRIDETLAPQPFQPPPIENKPSPNFDAKVFEELATLKSKYAEMEKNIARLRDDLTTFQESEIRPSTSEHNRPSPEPIYVGPNVPGASLPSFFADNPWLDVLSKRGRSENEPIAG